MNWGSKIILGLGSFMLFIVVSVIYMVSKDSDTLIDENYYETSLSYDDVYNSKQNLIRDNAKPILTLQYDSLIVQFSASENIGNINFKRPSDGSLDQVIPFKVKGSELKLPVSTFNKGNWNVEISWKQSGNSYVHTQALYIQ
jgi:nitrogen fixation protein FixH